MEMPSMMMNMMQQHQSPPITTKGEGGPGGAGELVGMESVTVPAGTFSCQHYRKTDQRGHHGPLDFQGGYPLGNGEDERPGRHHGVEEGPVGRNLPHQRGTTKDEYPRNAAVGLAYPLYAVAARAGISGPRVAFTFQDMPARTFALAFLVQLNCPSRHIHSASIPE